MTPLRVGIDVTPLLGPPSGIHQVTRGLLEGLQTVEEIEVRGWLLTARGARPDIDLPIHRSRIPAAVALRGWSRSGFPPARLVAGSVDVCHGTNFLAPPSSRSVVSLQDLGPITHPEWCVPAVAAMAGPIRRAASKGAAFHVSSALVRDAAIETLGLDADRVHLVHHGIRPLVGGDPATGRALAGSDRYLVVLGTVEPRKSVPTAVAALADLPADVRLVVVGPPGGDDDAVAAAGARLGPDRVRRLPPVDAHSRNALLRGATALLWPSRYEGFSLPPLEALQVGTPVVATATGALPELVGDEIDLVAPGDDDAFARAVHRVVESPPTVPTAVTRRLARLTWPAAARQMADVYRTAAG